MPSVGFLRACSSHLSFHFLISSVIGSWDVFFRSSSLLILFGHPIPTIFYRHLFTKLCSFLISLLPVTDIQLSKPWRSTDFILQSYDLGFLSQVSSIMKSRTQKFKAFDRTGGHFSPENVHVPPYSGILAMPLIAHKISYNGIYIHEHQKLTHTPTHTLCQMKLTAPIRNSLEQKCRTRTKATVAQTRSSGDSN